MVSLIQLSPKASTPLILFHQTTPTTTTTTTTTTTHPTTTNYNTITRRLIRRAPLTVTNASDKTNPTVTASQNSTTSSSLEIEGASGLVRTFYRGINGHDLASVADLIAEDCVYEDLIFPRPFVGRTAILEFFNKFIDSISMDLQFVIDDISAEDTSAVGVTWHLEWKGKAFPFSKGCSFYRLKVVNGKRQIVYGRDSVEPAIKPGETALVAIRGVTWLLQQFPQLADQL